MRNYSRRLTKSNFRAQNNFGIEARKLLFSFYELKKSHITCLKKPKTIKQDDRDQPEEVRKIALPFT